MRLGFTGTQRGMTDDQQRVVDFFLEWAGREPLELHEGDCVEADEHVARKAMELGWTVVAHPPTDASKRAYAPATVWREAQEYLERNRAIVDETQWLLAAPASLEEKLRSGTWATIRYARKLGRVVIIVWPTGAFTVEPVPWVEEADGLSVPLGPSKEI